MNQTVNRAEDKVVGNLRDLCREIARQTGGSCVEQAGFAWAKNPYSDWYCKSFDLKNPEEAAALGQSMATANAPNELLLPGSVAGESALSRALEGAGIRHAFDQTGMAYFLNAAPCFKREQGACEIITLSTEEQFAQWTAIQNEAFHQQEPPILYQILAKSPAINLYGVLEKGAVVATALLFLTGEVAGLYQVSTLPGCRGKGYATALMGHMMDAAATHGCKLCVLQASEMGRPVYERMGFEVVCAVSHWYYTPLEPQKF